ncbi:transmembrane protein 82-like [Clupea harengus]|uniref:Transmembrane protein 82-like n=1 Tax=Clupea harengus TaxID=7950 RepID=A0A6P3W312_CLUHA|nr:transmembrane protein 82-like [Clupea harengus]
MTFVTVMAWLPMEDNPLVSILKGLIGACGISLMCNLLRVCLFVDYTRRTPAGGTSEKPNDDARSMSRLSSGIQFVFLTGVLSLVGSRVSALIVLEFSLRAFLASLLFGQENRPEVTQQFLIQCQFSLGCALTCSLQFLHGGATHRWLSLLLAGGLSWFLSSQGWRLWAHVGRFYPQHCSQRDCGVCLILVSSGDALLPTLRRAVVMTFTVGIVAATAVMNQHFLLGAEDLKFWTPMTVSYILVLLRLLEDEKSRPGGQVMLQSAGLRAGALVVLLVMVGSWADVMQVLLFFLGESLCLLPSLSLLRSTAPLEGHKDPHGHSSSE